MRRSKNSLRSASHGLAANDATIPTRVVANIQKQAGKLTAAQNSVVALPLFLKVQVKRIHMAGYPQT